MPCVVLCGRCCDMHGEAGLLDIGGIRLGVWISAGNRPPPQAAPHFCWTSPGQACSAVPVQCHHMPFILQPLPRTHPDHHDGRHAGEGRGKGRVGMVGWGNIHTYLTEKTRSHRQSKKQAIRKGAARMLAGRCVNADSAWHRGRFLFFWERNAQMREHTMQTKLWVVQDHQTWEESNARVGEG